MVSYQHFTKQLKLTNLKCKQIRWPSQHVNFICYILTTLLQLDIIVIIINATIEKKKQKEKPGASRIPQQTECFVCNSIVAAFQVYRGTVLSSRVTQR